MLIDPSSNDYSLLLVAGKKTISKLKIGLRDKERKKILKS